MNLNRAGILFIILYTILMGIGIKSQLDKLPDAYSYTYHLSEFNLDAGVLTEDGIFIDSSSGYHGIFADSSVTTLQEGTYTFRIVYSSDYDSFCRFSMNAEADTELYLNPDQTIAETTIAVTPATDKFRIRFPYPGEGSLCIKEVSISSEQPLTNDTLYNILLLTILDLLAPFAYIYIRIRKLHFEKEQIILCILFLSAILLVNLPIFYDYLWFGVDTRAQLLRMEGIRIALSERQVPAIINANYCNNYGELGCMYPGLFLYIPALLRTCGISMLAAYKSLHVLINIATLFVMYACVKDLTHSRKSAALAALLYCFSPHRLYVMYPGGQALGMGIAMIFFPLMFVGLYHIFLGNHKKWYLLAIGLTGIVQSHILSTVLAISFCFIIMLCYLPQLWNENRLTPLLKSAFMTFLLNLYTLVPFLYYYKSGLTLENLERHFLVSLISAFDTFLSERGLVFLLCLLIITSWYLLCKIKKNNQEKGSEREKVLHYALRLLVIGIVTYFLSTELFPWSLLFKCRPVESMLSILQFPERFLLISAPAMIMGIGVIAEDLYQLPKRFYRILLIAICILACTIGFHMEWNGFISCDKLLTSKITGDINSRLQEDYLPAGTLTAYYTSNALVGKDESSITTISYHKDGTRIFYSYTCTTAENYVEFPLFYYDGYKAVDENGMPLRLEKGAQNKVRVYTEKTDSPKQITIYFSTFWYFKLCTLLSALSFLLLPWIIFRSRPTNKAS